MKYFDLLHFVQTLTGGKPLLNRFNKIDGFIRIYDGTRYLILFGPEKYDAIYEKVRFLTGQKTGTTYVFLIIMQKSKWIYIVPFTLPLEKTMTFMQCCNPHKVSF